MTVKIDRVVQVSVTRATRTAARRNFGVALIAAYHTHYPDLVREYADPDDMLTDGFSATEPAYLAALSLKAQDPSPASFKVGRRVGAPTQTMKLTPSATPLIAEVFSLTIGGTTFSVTADGTPTQAEIVTALVAAMTADVDSLIASGGVSSASIQVITTFNGVLAGDLSATPRNVEIVLSSHADWDATIAVLVGLDQFGRPQSENLSIPNGGAATVEGVKVWSRIDSLTIPAQSGSGGTYTLGTGVAYANPALVITPTSHSSYLTVAANVAGAWFAYTGITKNIEIEDTTAEPGTTLATDLAAIQAFDQAWYGLVVADAQSSAQILAIAAWVEAQSVLCVQHTLDGDVEQAVGSDIASLLLAASRFRTTAFYNRSSHGLFPDAALLGMLLPQNPGSVSPHLKALSGILPDDLSDAVVTRLIGPPDSPVSGKHCFIYVTMGAVGTNGGNSVTLGGLTPGGEWIDVIFGLDFLESLIQQRTFQRLLAMPKVPFTDAGADVLVGSTKSALRVAAGDDYQILVGTSILVSATPVASVSPSDKQNRFYDGIRWSADVQGAIHALKVRGTVSP